MAIIRPMKFFEVKAFGGGRAGSLFRISGLAYSFYFYWFVTVEMVVNPSSPYSFWQ